MRIVVKSIDFRVRTDWAKSHLCHLLDFMALDKSFAQILIPSCKLGITQAPNLQDCWR